MLRQTADLRWGPNWTRVVALSLLGGAAMLVGCGDDDKDDIVDPGPLREGCVECHTDQVRLEALAIPDEPPGETGEG